MDEFITKLSVFKDPARIALLGEYKDRLVDMKETLLNGEAEPRAQSEFFLLLPRRPRLRFVRGYFRAQTRGLRLVISDALPGLAL